MFVAVWQVRCDAVCTGEPRWVMARLGTVRQVGRVLVCCGMAGRDMAGKENQNRKE